MIATRDAWRLNQALGSFCTPIKCKNLYTREVFFYKQLYPYKGSLISGYYCIYVTFNFRALPFILLPKHVFLVTGNDRYKGFAIDMMEALAKSRNWTYEYKQVPDNLTGVELPNGSWSGMIGMLMTNVSLI